MERIELKSLRHGQRQRWRNGDEWDEAAAKIAVGRLADGRWYVQRYAAQHVRWPAPGVLAYAGQHAEHYALATAQRWMRTVGGTWVEAQAHRGG
ncbi:hypothetical protein ACQPZX_41375 [Actinoplanes sp. CA-142083]|uniref:hypothetical protein n=1 Tax=Actinoplanes sp. CA-142083 TaxID=3239903 RepID=UPI003D938501